MCGLCTERSCRVFVSLWYVYSTWRDCLRQRKSISAAASHTLLPMRCTDLYIKKQILYRMITGTKCVFIPRPEAAIFLQPGPTWTPRKGFIELTDFPLAVEWIVSQIAACFNKMTAEREWGGSADLIHKNVTGLSVLGWSVGVCVFVHIMHLIRQHL